MSLLQFENFQNHKHPHCINQVLYRKVAMGDVLFKVHSTKLQIAKETGTPVYVFCLLLLFATPSEHNLRLILYSIKME